MIQSCKLNTAFGIAEINTNIVESNPPSELLTSAAVGNLFTRCQRVVRKPIRYVTIHFQDRSGAASLRCKNRAEMSDSFVNRSPIRYGFCVGAQAIRYSVDIASVTMKTVFCTLCTCIFHFFTFCRRSRSFYDLK